MVSLPCGPGCPVYFWFQTEILQKPADGFAPSGVQGVPGQAIVLGFGTQLLFLWVGIFPLGRRHFELFPLLLCAPDLFTVFFHSLEVAVTNQLQEFLIPGFCPMWDAGLDWTGHLVGPVLFIVFVEHFLYSLLIHYLQGNFTDGMDKTVLYCLAKIGPSIHFANPKEE